MLNRLKIGTKIGAAFALGIGLFAALSVVAYEGMNELIDRSKWQTHTYAVLGELKELSVGVSSAEAGQRGYVITGQGTYLEPFTASRQQIRETLQELRRLTADNQNQQRRLDTLDPLLTERLEMMQSVINVRQQRGLTAAQEQVRTNQGKRMTDNIRAVLGEMEAEEYRLLNDRSKAAEAATRQTFDSITYGVPLYATLLALIGYLLSRHISRPLQEISIVTEEVGNGNLTVSVPPSDRRDEIGTLGSTFNQMITSLRDTTRKNEEQTWLQSNLAEFSNLLQGQRQQETVAQLILSRLAPLVGAQQGVFYLMSVNSESPVLKLLSTYAYRERKHLSNQFQLGEGLVGQCALEKQRILLTDVPGDYIRIQSGLGSAPPLNIVVLPVLFEQQVVAVIEFASLDAFSDQHLLLLDRVSNTLGVVLNSIAANSLTSELLQQSQALTEELQAQQDELHESNRRLEEQTEALRSSEALLKEQQEELQQTNEELQQLNEELEEKADLLTLQKRQVEQKNQEIELARQELEEKAAQLALSSKYKSEFLANMSHELRTPLNSLLILARLLSQNTDGNLTDKQVDYSRTIYSAGTDLLDLINDILDLARIESGMLSIEPEPVDFTELRAYLDRNFREVAQDKHLDFLIHLDSNLPTTLTTDPKRLQQILKNLLANAFKFTEHGGVTLTIAPTSHSSLPTSQIAFAVSDTGIGISADKQQIIFEAFQQADGTTSRKYGGTGLGLSISRELAQLLGGSITLASELEGGSTFTLYLPTQQNPSAVDKIDSAFLLQPSAPAHLPTAALPAPYPLPNDLNDDRDALQPGDRSLLIIEDDVNFVRILAEMARQQGFKVLVALRSSTGLALAQQFNPDAIMLDIRLPDLDGWAVLDRLKHDPATRHIPVHILSIDDAQQRGLQRGAIAYLQKPVSADALDQALVDIKDFLDRQVKTLLIVEDDIVQAQSIRDLIGEGDVETTIVGSGTDTLAALSRNRFDCVVLDLGLPDMSGFDLIEQIKAEAGNASPPIIIYTGKELTRQEETQLRRLAETIIVKDVRSPERLLDETALFLHRVQANLPAPKRQILEELHHTDSVLAHRKVLIVDDDVRNIFALTSLLEGYDMDVVYAENGRDGLSVLQANADVDAVLMDVMMPELDGYETTRAIRQQPQFKSLPIIALTAKAMQGDREKCLEAGASDYITKPVDTEQLLSLLRVWLYR
ncbi:response regulator [Leptolyngbya sp. FACHB-36]|uniref:response regulator n=1 Tax=Leptolyngbya sp. FACHB-36 TaxID=2692808 RepID=UPI00168039EF|nr:response regulator [Leptolyngbya sp. FACHB-36]MBD2022013.1 response regulator [Leptolyngbya sp. FACHB-36]